jgi:hypothetical protein
MIERTVRKFQDNSWLAVILTLGGVVLYSVQAWAYIHIQTSFVDEGGYLYLGDLYLRGILRPFQDFGPIRQYAPLAYLIPGQIEQWFGPGLFTGRFFSAFCGLLMLIPLWLTARRFGGKWWATAIIWIMALTPVSVQIYSLALSQAFVACLMAWSLFFVLGEKRPIWQIVAGSILSGLTVMTRQNLVLFPPLLVAYVFWQYGRKAGWWSIFSSLLPILIIHIIYWPNILQIWVIWLPANLIPFLKAYQLPPTAQSAVAFPGLSSILLSFVQGYRFHYFSMVGFIVCLFLWPGAAEWKKQVDKRAAYFLATLFLLLLLLHAWGSIFSTNISSPCTFCFTPYLAFFDITALLLIIVSFASWRKKASMVKQIGIVLFFLILSPGLGYAAYDRFGPWLLTIKFPAFNRGLNPRLWIPFITPWDILANKFHVDYWKSRTPVVIVAGFILGMLFLILGRLIYKKLSKRGKTSNYSFGAFLLLALLGLGVLLSPLMGGSYLPDGLCMADIPHTYKQIGTTLSNLIPFGSQVYWDAKTSVPLLYAPGISIYPSQIYGLYGYRIGGDPHQMVKNGLYNDELARLWREKADFIVTESSGYNIQIPGGDLDTLKFEAFRTAPANPCDPYSYLIVYKRKPVVH